MQRERAGTHTDTCGGCTQRQRQTGTTNTNTQAFSHCKSRPSVLPPHHCPSLQSGVDIRLVQKGSAQLIAGPLGVGVGWGMWVGGGLREQQLGDSEAYPAPSDIEVKG